MRILHLYSGNLYGGVETVLVTLARCRALGPSLDHQFGLCFEGRLSRELIKAGARLHWLGQARCRRPWTVWRVRRALRELLRREPFDVVVCHLVWSAALFGPVVRSEGLPVLLWAHDPAKRWHWLDLWARRTPYDLILCNSRFTAQTVLDQSPVAPVEVLYNPVAATLDHGQETRAAVRRELETPLDAQVILQVSRLEPWKGQREHLQALGPLASRPGWVCWLAGGSQRPQEAVYEKSLRVLAREMGLEGRVRFLGQRADVARLLMAADIFCQPNNAPEPFGVSLIEALYAGLPVVTTALGGALEIIDDSCALGVAPADTPGLSATLGRLLEDAPLRARLGAAGPDRARFLCDPAIQMRRLADAVARCAAGGRAP